LINRFKPYIGFCSDVREVGFARFFYCLFFGSNEKRRGLIVVSEDLIITEIEGFVEPVAQELGLELVEVQFRREGGGWILRLFIDREGGVTVDDCAALSRQVSAYLEVEDCIEHAYTLEVSSPGVERPLKRKEDFIRFAGRKARIKLMNPVDGQRVFIGLLGELQDNTILLDIDGQQMEIDLGAIARARLVL
jgi:ribosome maturation factor RimP